jgi:hypothetical protein
MADIYEDLVMKLTELMLCRRDMTVVESTKVMEAVHLKYLKKCQIALEIAGKKEHVTFAEYLRKIADNEEEQK